MVGPYKGTCSIPSGQGGTLPPTTGVETITTKGITLTITSLPTSADNDARLIHNSRSCDQGEPVIVWDIPEIPQAKFKWPKFPELPNFRLACIKVFDVTVAGQSPKPPGPAPVNDNPPPHPRRSSTPPDTAADPCEFDTKSGIYNNGNYLIYNASSNTITCNVLSDQLRSKVSYCQQKIDSKIDAIKDYLKGKRSCCPISSKARRQDSGGSFPSLITLGLDSLGLRLDTRGADFCPAKNEDPKNPGKDKGHTTYTRPHELFPNVCGNAKSAIEVRGATSIDSCQGINTAKDKKTQSQI
ncbi:hypothetical protein F53441_2486 [Fusarium austroafricanum]|uniref:Uncharacterized protein n=1 Tax=Fusarium austroafricanum TaxID=2364996 RepID=A0A8H4KR87_9HYPO|nr:hypothetical protein F53441_2486 [Fusarium austroafricanum]